MDRYQNMEHRFNIARLLFHSMGIHQIGYPSMPSAKMQATLATGGTHNNWPQAVGRKTILDVGSAELWRQNGSGGQWFFMPVDIRIAGSKTLIELPCAVISVTGKKTIVSTPLQGRRGSVKELVSVADYEIAIACVAFGDDGNYPERAVRELRDLYELNESVELISAITSLIFNPEDKVVIKSMDIPAVGAVQNAQAIKFTAETDSSLELIIE